VKNALIILVTYVVITSSLARSVEAQPLTPDRVDPSVFLDRSGFPELVVHTSLWSTWMGLNIATLAYQNQDLPDEFMLLTPLAIAGATVAGTILLNHKKPVYAGQAAFYNLAQRWGTTTGFFLPSLWSSLNANHSLASMVLGGVGAFAGAIFLYPELNLSPGQVSALGTVHTFTTIATALISTSIDLIPDNGWTAEGPVLVTSNLAIFGAYWLRDFLDVDRRRLIWLDVGGYLGLATSWGLSLTANSGEKPVLDSPNMAKVMLLGMSAGLALSYFLTDGSDDFKAGIESPNLWGLTLEQPIIRPTLSRHPITHVNFMGMVVDVIRGSF